MTPGPEPTSATPTDDDRLVELVRAALECQERGEAVDPLALAGGDATLAGSIADALGLDSGLDALHRATADRDPLQGVVLADRYELDACVGRGAMGTVYRGTDRELDRVVAIKLFDPTLSREGTAEARFLQEARLLAALRHDHVVAVHDRGRDAASGRLWLVMDWLPGASLAALQARHLEVGTGLHDEVAWLDETLGATVTDRPERTWLRLVVHWLADVADGLATAHERGVLHRDVKPSNIIVTDQGEAMLLDFGIATEAGDHERLTLTPTALGTPWYMAPEQARGEPVVHSPNQVAATIDVYGLTATMYHLLTGQPPFEGDARAVLTRLARGEDPMPAHRLCPDLPRDLRAILDRGLAPEPGDRYPGVGALRDDLRAFLDHRPVSARPLSGAQRFVRRCRRAPARVLAVVSTVAAAAALVVVVSLQSTVSADARTDELNALKRSLPSLLAIEGLPDQRLLVDLSERGELIAVLDRIVELDPDDLPSRLWRAALRLDQGDGIGAARDVETLAATTSSPYLAAVAARYANADPNVRGTVGVDLADLPEPASDADHFVAGFHALRNRHLDGWAQRALDLLTVVAERDVPARDLRLIALLGVGDAERTAAPFREAVREAVALAGVYGAETARTLAVRGAALTALKQYDAAEELLRESLRLRPDRHGPLQNLGICLRHLDRPLEARQMLLQAHALRPHLWNTTHTLALVERDLGDLDRAFELARSLPDDRDDNCRWMKPDLLGSLWLRRAYEASRARAPGAGAAFDSARECFTDALDADPPSSEAKRIRLRTGIATSIQAEDLEGAAKRFLLVLRKTPKDSAQIANLASLLNFRELDAEGLLYLRLFLRDLAIALNPDDERLRKQLKSESQKDIDDAKAR